MPRSSAEPTPTIDAIDFYSRPGCVISMVLHHALKRRGVPMRVHDIWSDPDAAARVRAAARGDETVPTIGIGTHALVNPRVSEVLGALELYAPLVVIQRPAATSVWQRLWRGIRRQDHTGECPRSPRAD